MEKILEMKGKINTQPYDDVEKNRTNEEEKCNKRIDLS